MRTLFFSKKNQSGQSLIEVLISVTIGGILIGSAAILITLALRTSLQNKFIQAASFLAQDLAEKVTVYAEGRWYCPPSCSGGNYGIYNLNKGQLNHYYLNTAVTPFQSVLASPPATGGESKIVDGITYTRYFYVVNGCRDGSNDLSSDYSIDSGLCTGSSTTDPSTIQITSVVEWPDQGGGSVKIVKYLTRHNNRVAVQTDWSGGATTPGDLPVTTFDNQFFEADADVDFANEPGFIKILGT